jgi:hypothetical protein
MSEAKVREVVRRIKEAPYGLRMGGYCYAWAAAIRRVLLPQGRIVIAINDPIFLATKKKRLLGHAAVKFKNVFFDSEGETSLADLKGWGMLDPKDREYALAAGVNLAKWATLAEKVGVYTLTEGELFKLSPAAGRVVDEIEAALRKSAS